MTTPYTHADHAARCRQAAQACVVLKQFVQVRLAGASHCGRIAGAWTTADGLDLWTVELSGPYAGRCSLPVSKVTQCSGLDGRCVCASLDGSEGSNV